MSAHVQFDNTPLFLLVNEERATLMTFDEIIDTFTTSARISACAGYDAEAEAADVLYAIEPGKAARKVLVSYDNYIDPGHVTGFLRYQDTGLSLADGSGHALTFGFCTPNC